MTVSRFVPWIMCNAVLLALFGVLLIEFSAVQEPCMARPCPPVAADHTVRSATHGLRARADVAGHA